MHLDTGVFGEPVADVVVGIGKEVTDQLAVASVMSYCPNYWPKVINDRLKATPG